MNRSSSNSSSSLSEPPLVFILHCGLDVKRVERSCQRLGLNLTISVFRREEVFAYYVRLDRPRPDLILIRSHFRSLVTELNTRKDIATLIVSTYQEPEDCPYQFIQALQGYEGSEAFPLYQRLAEAMNKELSAK